MFIPRYTITEKLLSNIKKITGIVQDLNGKSFPKTVLYELERIAREISSFASTSIEGNPLPLTDVKQLLKAKPENIRQSEQEVLNYNQALIELNNKLRNRTLQLNLDLILSIHAKVTDNLIPKHQIGKLRTDPVFVNDPRTGKTVYWPPEAKEVESLLTDLISYVNGNRVKKDPLILAGIFHKHFVIIHPFMDGNGRTVRLATKALLADMGVNSFHLFSFENYYNKNVAKYFNNVGESGNYYDINEIIDMTSWLEYFTDGVIDELLRVRKELEKLSSITPEKELLPHHQTIINYIKEKGFIKDNDYAKLTERAKATRILDFKKLLNLGIIKRQGKGKNTYYILKNSI